LEMRSLGSSGLAVSALGFGTMTFGGAGWVAAYGSTTYEEAALLVDVALERGVNLFDTADIYSDGASEEMLGKIAKGRRERMVIATKCFGRTGPGEDDVGLSRGHIIAACDASLRRLGIDHIDLYQTHNFDGITPLEETICALTSLIDAGKVRHIGCSNHFGWELTKALDLAEMRGLSRYVSQQVQYSLLVRDIETEILPAAIKQDVGTIVWGPLAGGYLSGKFSDGAAKGSRIDALRRLGTVDTEQARSIVRSLDAIAASRGASVSQVALNWLLSRPGISSVLVGARNAGQLRDNLGAAEWELSQEEIATLDACSAPSMLYPQAHRARFEPSRNPPGFK
jgi:aryl-alcohol dehydrogenase-like predicted oxidoreductase